MSYSSGAKLGAQQGTPINQGAQTNQFSQYREPTQMVTFVYKNWKGEIRKRRVIPLNIEFGHDNYHTQDQWLMHAIDMEKGARRTFAFRDMITAPKGTQYEQQ